MAESRLLPKLISAVYRVARWPFGSWPMNVGDLRMSIGGAENIRSVEKRQFVTELVGDPKIQHAIIGQRSLLRSALNEWKSREFDSKTITTGGNHGDDFITVGATPGMGKTTMLSVLTANVRSYNNGNIQISGDIQSCRDALMEVLDPKNSNNKLPVDFATKLRNSVGVFVTFNGRCSEYLYPPWTNPRKEFAVRILWSYFVAGTEMSFAEFRAITLGLLNPVNCVQRAVRVILADMDAIGGGGGDEERNSVLRIAVDEVFLMGGAGIARDLKREMILDLLAALAPIWDYQRRVFFLFSSVKPSTLERIMSTGSLRKVTDLGLSSLDNWREFVSALAPDLDQLLSKDNTSLVGAYATFLFQDCAGVPRLLQGMNKKIEGIKTETDPENLPSYSEISTAISAARGYMVTPASMMHWIVDEDKQVVSGFVSPFYNEVLEAGNLLLRGSGMSKKRRWDRRISPIMLLSAGIKGGGNATYLAWITANAFFRLDDFVKSDVVPKVSKVGSKIQYSSQSFEEQMVFFLRLVHIIAHVEKEAVPLAIEMFETMKKATSNEEKQEGLQKDIDKLKECLLTAEERCQRRVNLLDVLQVGCSDFKVAAKIEDDSSTIGADLSSSSALHFHRGSSYPVVKLSKDAENEFIDLLKKNDTDSLVALLNTNAKACSVLERPDLPVSLTTGCIVVFENENFPAFDAIKFDVLTPGESIPFTLIQFKYSQFVELQNDLSNSKVAECIASAIFHFPFLENAFRENRCGFLFLAARGVGGDFALNGVAALLGKKMAKNWANLEKKSTVTVKDLNALTSNDPFKAWMSNTSNVEKQSLIATILQQPSAKSNPFLDSLNNDKATTKTILEFLHGARGRREVFDDKGFVQTITKSIIVVPGGVLVMLSPIFESRPQFFGRTEEAVAKLKRERMLHHHTQRKISKSGDKNTGNDDKNSTNNDVCDSKSIEKKE